jgi:uncharacterized membrane protein YfcA
MISAKAALFVALAGFTLFYVAVWVVSVRGGELKGVRWPTALQSAIGFVADFFDTLGIGSFATTTAMWRSRGVVPDQLIPGTLNVGHTLPTIAEAFIYILIIAVDVKTMIAMILASVVGAWLGAGVVAGWPAQKVRVGMGLALLAAAGLMFMSQLQLGPKGGEALQLEGTRLLIGVAGNFMLGALMSLGIGLYAPCLILVSLLGMAPTAAFPIMMGSCAFLMPVGSARFVRTRAIEPQAALGLALGGIPGVLIAAFIVKSLPLAYVRWLVIVVVVYTAVAMLRDAARERRVAATAA